MNEDKDLFSYYDSLASTNTKAAEEISRYDGPLWVWARQQTCGRGRRGKTWQSEKGNFYASYLQKVDGPLDQLALFSFVAGLAVHATLEFYLGTTWLLGLKWPNDIMLEGKKVAGILLENATHDRQTYLVTGFGVNLTSGPQLNKPGARCITPGGVEELTGTCIDSRDFLHRLAMNYDMKEDIFHRDGYATIRHQWLERAYMLGQEVTVTQGDAEITGIFETITNDGCAVIVNKGGETRISAGDLFFGNHDHAPRH